MTIVTTKQKWGEFEPKWFVPAFEANIAVDLIIMNIFASPVSLATYKQNCIYIRALPNTVYRIAQAVASSFPGQKCHNSSTMNIPSAWLGAEDYLKTING